MHVAHIGPPASQRGGPAGYLRQLEAALRAEPHPTVRVTFPAPPPPNEPMPAAPAPSWLARARMRMRALTGRGRFYRPSVKEVRRAGGPLHTLLENAARTTLQENAPSMAAAGNADVVFTHDPWSAKAALRRRRPGQQVWQFVHTPMPLGLYVAWCWGIPEWSWQEVSGLDDVTKSIAEQRTTWERLDHLVFPCEEAREEFARIDPQLLEVDTPVSYVLTGAQAAGEGGGRDRTRWGLPEDAPVALYLGNAQAYRGLDVLAQAVDQLSPGSGVLAVAGPEPGQVPTHPRIRALGRVSDVASLLATSDFFVNVNRFSLFDLSLVEAVQAGKPLLLHQVGGNRAFSRLGAGVLPITDLEPTTVAGALESAFSLSDETRAELGGASRRCYEEHLTFAAFARSHLALYQTARTESAPS